VLRVLWQLTRGYRLRPWRSPYLRWRIETYWGIGADDIQFFQFWNFILAHWRELVRYLRWAAALKRGTHGVELIHSGTAP